MQLLCSLSFVFFMAVPQAGADNTQTTPPAVDPILRYRQALNHLPDPQSCQNLHELAKADDFSLKDVAQLRYMSQCPNQENWSDWDKQITQPTLRPLFVQLWFESLIKEKKYHLAYRLYATNQKLIKLDKKEYEKLALPALTSQLTQKEKAEIRKTLEKQSPRFIAKPKATQELKVAYDFRNNREFEKALTYYKKIINDPKRSLTLRWKAFRGARMTYKLERWSRMDSYLKASKQWANFLRHKFKSDKKLVKLHHDANIEYIRTLWTERGQSQATGALNLLEKELSGRYSLQLVYWLKGRMAEERGEYKQAVADLQKATEEKSLGVRDDERILWSLAWNQRRIGAFQQSHDSLEKLKKSPDTTFFALTKYAYWEAENLLSAKKKDEAHELFRSLAEMDPFGYYGPLALRKIGQAFPKPPNNPLPLAQAVELLPKEQRQFFKDLASALELDIAEDLVKLFVQKQKGWEREDWLLYLTLLQEAGAYKSSFLTFHSLKPEHQSHFQKEYPQLLFPTPFSDEVQSASDKTHVSPALIYSIMKQESGFDVKARSHADAFGLLQLIPQVAKKMAENVQGIEFNDPRDLFEPSVIVTLGAEHLRQLFSKYNGNFIVSVASYNASEKAVQGWIKSRYKGDPVEFIEDIPYEETKGYVKLVMRNYIVYNRLETPELEFSFPESCLSGLDQLSSQQKK